MLNVSSEHIAPHRLPDHSAAGGSFLPSVHVMPEYGPECVPVGDVEKAKRDDGGVKVKSVQATAHYAFAFAPPQDVVDGFQSGGVFGRHGRPLRHLAALVDVLHHHEACHIGVLAMKVKR